MRLLQTLLAFITGIIAAVMWLDRRTSPQSAPDRPPPPPPSKPPEPERIVERVVEQVIEHVPVPDPEQAAKIEALEAELVQQRALKTPEPSESHPGVDAIRAARIRALELERQLSRHQNSDTPRWFEIDPPAPDDLLDTAAKHLPNVAIWIEPESLDPTALWKALGAMQEFADASGEAWFEFNADFARWCSESGHPHALDPDQVGTDDQRPIFPVQPRVNRSGQIATPAYIQLQDQRLHYIDDIAGETHRIHIVGQSQSPT